MNPVLKLTIILYFLYTLGVLAHVLLRAGYAIRNPVNPIASRGGFIKTNWDTILVRTFLSTIAFSVWINHPMLVSTAFAYFKIPLNFDIPLTNATAAMFGYLSDSVLDSAQSAIAAVPQLAWLNNIFRGQIPAFPQEKKP
jgi:hypothetical protein